MICEKSVSNKKMAKERLSKLRKWILEKCLKDLKLHRQNAFEFFGKKFSERYRNKKEWLLDIKDIFKRLGRDPRYYFKKDITGLFWDFDKKKYTKQTRRFFIPKEEMIITRSEQAVITRSLKGLVKKGFLIQPRKWGEYKLTGKGFLKANKVATACEKISFKDYQRKIDKAEKERERAHKKSLASIATAFKSKAK